MGKKKTSGKKAPVYKKALDTLAMLKYRRSAAQQPLRIIAITGAVGKTTTVRLVAELLRESEYKVLEMIAGADAPRSFETDGVLLQKRLYEARRQRFDFVVLEVHAALVESAAYQTLSIETLVATTDNPEFEVLSSPKLKHVIVPYGMTVPDGIERYNVMTFGREDNADMKIVGSKLYRKGTELTLVIDQHDQMEVASYLVGHANVLNVAAALATAYVMGVNVSKFAEGVARVEEIPANYTYITPRGPYTLVADTASNAEAINALIETAKELTKRRLVVALAEKLAEEELVRHHKIVDRLIVVGEAPIVGVTKAHDHEEAGYIAVRGAKKDDLVLLIGRPYAELDESGRLKVHKLFGEDSEQQS